MLLALLLLLLLVSAVAAAVMQGGGEFTSLQAPPDAASYQLLMHSSSNSMATAAPSSVGNSLMQQPTQKDDISQQQQQQQQQQWSSASADGLQSLSDSGVLTPVPLIASKPTQKAAEYRLQLFTADKLSAGLPAGQKVLLQVLGPCQVDLYKFHSKSQSLPAKQQQQQSAASDSSSSSSSRDAALGPVLLQAELPRARNSFGRGSTEAFTVLSSSGDVGDIAAVLLWHEPDGGSLGGGWCLERVEIEAKFKGIKYSFVNNTNNGWVGRGRSRAVLLGKPRISKRGDSEALQLEVEELQRQLVGNAGLSGEDRALLHRRLGLLQARLAASM
jgi:hypothetical protein